MREVNKGLKEPSDSNEVSGHMCPFVEKLALFISSLLILR